MISGIWSQKDKGVALSLPLFLTTKPYFVESYGRVYGFWLFAYYYISWRPFLSCTHIQGVKLKLFQYKNWFLPNFELKDFWDLTSTVYIL